MISFDLSRFPSPRFLVYLLALFPGLFLLLSIAFGNPELAKQSIRHVQDIYSAPAYALLLLLLGSAFVIGQALILLAWFLEMLMTAIYRFGRAAYRLLLGGNRVYAWFAKFQGIPPKETRTIQLLRKLIIHARAPQSEPPDAPAVRFCLSAATEKLLEKRYGIDMHRATGPNGGEWEIWRSVMGKPLRSVIEARNAARTILACGLAGFLAIRFSPALAERYYIAMCLVFIVSGLWTSGYFFLLGRNPARLDFLRLRSVLLELQDLSSEAPGHGK